MALPLSFADLTLGTTVEIPHIDSENLKIKVPPSSNPGETITIHGRACPSMETLQKRFSYCSPQTSIPKKTTRSLKNKIKEIRAELEESIPPIEERIRRKPTLEGAVRVILPPLICSLLEPLQSGSPLLFLRCVFLPLEPYQ